MAYSANGHNYPDKFLSRVKYDLEYDSDNSLYRFKGKPQEVIKVADSVATNVFFDNTNNYNQIWFGSSTLDYIYGDQIFFDVANNKNLIVVAEPITLDCLLKVTDFINHP